MSLSDMTYRVAKPNIKPYKLFDGEGLYLEIMPSGVKSWRLKYRMYGKEKRIVLGLYPALSLAAARIAKDDVKSDLRKGIDPILAKQETKQLAAITSSQTFELVAIEWHTQNLAQWDPRYAQTVMYRLEKYVFPQFGQFPVDGLKPAMILACLRKIELSAPEMARRIKQLCSHIFKYAIITGKCENDPTYGLETAMKKYKKGNFASISVDELPELIHAIEKHKSRLYRQTFIAINLMLLTFVRTSELLNATWAEVDLQNAKWIIPAHRMKKSKDHIVPLSKQSITWLLELKEIAGCREHLFPSIPRPKKPMCEGTILVALKRMGYGKKMTGHGFRSLALGILKEKLGYSHEIADRQLAHVKKNNTDRAYDRAEFLPQRTEMMQAYADYLSTVNLNTAGSNPAPATNLPIT